MDNRLFFAKVKEGAVIPSKNLEDAGYDVYACFDSNFMVIPPATTMMIPTGISSAFSTDYVAVVKERGSTGTKGMGVRAGVIDSGFRGEWQIVLTNHNSKPIVILKDGAEVDFPTDYIIYPYSKAIAQFLILPVPVMEVIETTQDEVKSFVSLRGDGMLGSSDK